MSRLKNYKSRCICIITVTFNQVGRKILKLSCTVLSLLATVQSSDVVTNKITDVYHASAMEKNIVPKCAEVKNTKEYLKDTKKDIKKENIKISNKKVENSKNKKSSKINDKTISIVKNLVNNNSKKSIQPKAQKIASAANTKSTKNTKNCFNPTDYECTDVLTGDATFYTAKPGKRMSNGELPIAGVHCAMHPKYKDSWAKITFSNGKTKLLKVGDTGGALINGGAVVDIFCATRDECLQNGRKKVKVEILHKKKNIHKKT